MKKIVGIMALAISIVSLRAEAAVTLSKDFNTTPLSQNVFSTTCVTSQVPTDPTNNVGYLTSEYSTDGGMSFKSQVRKSDPICGNSHRTEMHLSTTSTIMQNAEWIAWDTYQPTSQPNDTVPYLDGQLHGATIVPMGLWVTNGTNIKLQLQSRPDGVNLIQKTFDLGNIGTKGVWHKWVLHFKRATDNTGLVEFWADGVKKVTYNGPTMDLNETQFYFKFGIYKWSILNSLSDTTVSYTDNIKFGDKSATINDFISSTTPDTTAPTVSLTSPLAGTVSGTVTLSASATDNTGVSKVDFYQGGTIVGTSTTAPYNFAWNTTTVANGIYSLKAIAYDAAGNMAISNVVQITVSNISLTPTISLVAPTNAATVSGIITLTAAGANITSIDFYKNTDTAPFATTVLPNTSVAFDTASLSNGLNTFKVVGYGTNGTTISSSPITLTVSNVLLTPTAPTNVVAVAGYKKIRVSWTAPSSNGGSPITSYTATSTPGSKTASVASSPVSFSSLTNGTAYTFKVVAKNSAGSGTVSASSVAVAPVATFTTGRQVQVSVSGTLNVRKTANGTKIGSVTDGTLGTVLQSSSGWTQVQFSGITGWVSNSYLFYTN